jgi:quercetin dioxygenase-like cupin family protein
VRGGAAAVAVAVAVGCGGAQPAAVGAQRSAAGSAASSSAGDPADATTGAPEVTREESLAAIQQAMTDLDPVAHQCWGAAAVDRFDIAGNLELRVTVTDRLAEVVVVADTVRNPKLVACMTAVLERYGYAPPLRGQTFQLPFAFRAPDGQSTIDRRLVAPVAQGKLAVSVLLDAANTGNAAASMIELAIAPGGRTGVRVAERAELWYFLADAQVARPFEAPHSLTPVSAGDMMFVPAGGVRDVEAGSADARAVIVVVPGGREGTARAGALPTREADAQKPYKGPIVLRAAAAKTYGPVAIYAEPATIPDQTLAASILSLPAGATVAEHVHAKETELLYVLDGSGTLTVAGVALPVTPTTVVQIPANTPHSFATTTAFRAVQVYTPAGPEQRFKK